MVKNWKAKKPKQPQKENFMLKAKKKICKAVKGLLFIKSRESIQVLTVGECGILNTISAEQLSRCGVSDFINWPIISIKRLINKAPEDIKTSIKEKIEELYNKATLCNNIVLLCFLVENQSIDQMKQNLSYLVSYTMGFASKNDHPSQLLQLFIDQYNSIDVILVQFLHYKKKIWEKLNSNDNFQPFMRIRDQIVSFLQKAIICCYYSLTPEGTNQEYLKQFVNFKNFEEELKYIRNQLGRINERIESFFRQIRQIPTIGGLNNVSFFGECSRILILRIANNFRQRNQNKVFLPIFYLNRKKLFDGYPQMMISLKKSQVMHIIRPEVKEQTQYAVYAWIKNNQDQQEEFMLNEEDYDTGRISQIKQLKIKIFQLENFNLCYQMGEMNKNVQISISQSMPRNLLDLCLKQQLKKDEELKYQGQQFLVYINQRQLAQSTQIQQNSIIRLFFKICIMIFWGKRRSQCHIYQNQQFDDIYKYRFRQFNQKKLQKDKLALKWWKPGSQSGQLLQNQSNFLFLQNFNSTLQVIQKQKLEYIGFNKNYPIKFDSFQKYHPKSCELLQELKQNYNDINSINSMNNQQNQQKQQKQQEQKFNSKIIDIIFYFVKRTFKIEDAFSLMRTHINQIFGLTIWNKKDTKFYQQFLIYYILYNSDTKTKVNFMKCIKNLHPLPIVQRQFSSINVAKDQWKINQELAFLSRSNFNVVSIGIYKSDPANRTQFGKSELLNTLMKTSFNLHSSKHLICQGCPQVYLNFLNQKFPINIIDIPYGTKKQYVEKILSVCNFLIVHSWVDKKTTNQQIRMWRERYDIQNYKCYLRDQNYSQSQVTLDVSPVPNLTNKEINDDQPIKNALRKDLWPRIYKMAEYYHFINEGRNLTSIFDNKICQRVQRLVTVSKLKQINLYKFLKDFKKAKDLRKTQGSSVLDKFQSETKRNNTKNLIGEIDYNLLEYMHRNKSQVDLILTKIDQIFKQYQSLVHYKYEKLAKLKKQLLQSRPNILESSRREIERLKYLFQRDQLTQILNGNEIYKNLNQLQRDYKQNIKPYLPSKQLFFKQLKYLIAIDPEKYIDLDNHKEIISTQLTQVLHTQAIQNNQPSQLIDGDMMEVPYETLSQVFNMNQKVIVIVIFGQQSSGKSTLLNFLFGTAYKVSAGRCTKGANLTYFRFQQKKYQNCDGIIVVDTEGLSAVLDKNNDEKAVRSQFDDKIVLHCLNIADIVILNTKGNLDQYSKNIIMKNSVKLRQLNPNNQDLPTVFVVLNNCTEADSSQMNSTNDQIQTLSREHIKVAKKFIIPSAFQISRITDKDLGEVAGLMSKNQSVSKIKTKREIVDKIDDLNIQIEQVIHAKSRKMRKLIQFIDSNEYSWKFINWIKGFKTLQSENIILQQKRQKQQINKQINQFQQFIQEKVKDLDVKDLAEFKGKLRQVEQQMQNKLREILKNFQNKLKGKEQEYQKQRQQFQTLKKSLYNEMRKQLNNIIYNFNDDYGNKYKQKVQKLHYHNFGEKYAQCSVIQVKQRQKTLKKELDKSQKQEILKQKMNLGLQQFEKQRNIKQNQLNCFQNILINYDHNLDLEDKPRLLREIIKPNQFLQRSSQETKTQIQETISKQFNGQLKGYIKFIQSEQLMNMKFEKPYHEAYLSMNDYFEEKPAKYQVVIERESVIRSINKYILKKQLQQGIENIQISSICNIILGLINLVLLRQLGFKIVSQNKFAKGVKAMLKFQILKNQVGTPNFEIDIEYLQSNSQMMDQAIQFKFTCQKSIQAEKINNPLRKDCPLQKDRIRKVLLENIIMWDQVRYHIENDENYKRQIQRCQGQISRKLNNELQQINLELKCSNFVYFIRSDGQFSPTIKKSEYGNQKTIKKFEDVQSNLKKFKYFDGKSINRNSKKIGTMQNQNQIIICQIDKKQFIVKPEYSNNRQFNKQLENYMKKTSSDYFQNLKQEIRSFVVSELKRKKSFEKLYQFIQKVVKKTDCKRNVKNIKHFYTQIRQEINHFNDSLAQVNYCLSDLYENYLHFYALILFWKKNSDQLKQEYDNEIKQLKSEQKYNQSLEYLLKSTSLQNYQRIEVETKKFLLELNNQVVSVVQSYKAKYLQDKVTKFKQINTRKNVQKQCYKTILRDDCSSKEYLDHQSNPHLLIRKIYQDLADQLFSQLQRNLGDTFQTNFKHISKIESPQTFTQYIKNSVNRLQKNLQNSGIKIEARLDSLFESGVKMGENASFGYVQTIQLIYSHMFKLVLRYIARQEIQDFQQQGKFTLIPKKSITKDTISELPSKFTKEVLKQFQKINLKVPDLLGFCKQILSQQNNQKFIQIQNSIKKMFNLTQIDKQNFKAQAVPHICWQVSPCCGRLCGREDIHSDQHCVIYGHRIRGLNKIALENQKASTRSCQQLQDYDKVKTSGNDSITFMQWKMNWNSRNNSWNFDDLKDKQLNKTEREEEWKKYGQQICRNNGIKYCQIQDALQTLPDNIHYIIVIDESGSMNETGYNPKQTKWQQLIRSLADAIDEIIKIMQETKQKIAETKVSVIAFNHRTRIICENINPNRAITKIKNLKCDKGGSNFQRAFEQAIRLIQKYIGDSRIKFIFMTDGQGEQYPERQIRQLQQIKNNGIFLNRLQFYSILFDGEKLKGIEQPGQSMIQQINRQLGGTNKLAFSESQLSSAFVQCIRDQAW